MKRWEHFMHGADIGIRGIGDTMEAAFEAGALALTGVVVDPKQVGHANEVLIRCDSADREVLFVDWLNSIIYEMSTQRMLFGDFRVHLSGGKLDGSAWGEKVDRVKHEPAVEPKGATYTELAVKESNGIWIAQCVVDV